VKLPFLSEFPSEADEIFEVIPAIFEWFHGGFLVESPDEEAREFND